MKAARFFPLDHQPAAWVWPGVWPARARAWLPAAVVGLVIVLLLAALPPELADICGQDGALVCGP